MADADTATGELSAGPGVPLDQNYLWSVILDVALFFLVPILLIYGTLGLGIAEHGCEPSCDAGWIAVGSNVLVWGVLGGFVLTVVVSIVLLRRRRRSFYVPIVGGIVMIGCVEVAFRVSGLRE